MQLEGIRPNTLTFIYCLRCCCKVNDINSGDKVHVDIARHSLHKDLYLGTALVDMYAKCGALDKAVQVFDMLEARNVVSWTALISGFVEQGNSERALDYYECMLLEGVVPNCVTFICSLKACCSGGAIDKALELHSYIEREGFLRQDPMIGVTLVDMYAKCGLLAKAQHVFHNLPCQNVISWNALITGYVEHGYGDRALHCYEQMQHKGVTPDSVTFLCSLKGCSIMRSLAKGQELHFEVERRGLVYKDIAIANTLVDMYAKCGPLFMAQQLFDKLPDKNLVAWNSLIAGYAENGSSEKVVELFKQMQEANICPDSVSYLCGLKAFCNTDQFTSCRDLLDQVLKDGLSVNDIYVGSTLVSMYAKHGDLVRAQEVFDGLPVRDVVAWNALAAGYAEHGCGEDALQLLEKMESQGVSPNAVTYLCSLKACSSMGAVDKGRDIHVEVERRGLLEKELIGNTLVNMYAKCGLLTIAHQVFCNLKFQNVVSWTALMAGYGQRGESNVVFRMFLDMVESGVKPNPVTLVVILSACNRACLFTESQNYFEMISKDYGIPHTIKHHACMVDLFGRSGHLDNALSLVNKMPFSPNLVVWHIILGACKGIGSIGIGKHAFNHALQSDENDCTSVASC
ncbi:hypothetical protein KP509_09G027000 [Ceratopteris richardii]|nr:hypothetical protein KP509_09G027000 [Ceratopteris richardii]